MNKLTEFVTYFTSLSNTILNYAIIAVFATIILLITVTELMKTFNPNINTTKEAIEHIVTHIKEEEETIDNDENVERDIIQTLKFYKLDFIVVPMLGLFSIITIGVVLFPEISARGLETAMTYYIPITPYIAFFVMLYIFGVMTFLIVKVVGRKTFELISVISEKYKETVKENNIK